MFIKICTWHLYTHILYIYIHMYTYIQTDITIHYVTLRYITLHVFLLRLLWHNGGKRPPEQKLQTMVLAQWVKLKLAGGKPANNFFMFMCPWQGEQLKENSYALACLRWVHVALERHHQHIIISISSSTHPHIHTNIHINITIFQHENI